MKILKVLFIFISIFIFITMPVKTSWNKINIVPKSESLNKLKAIDNRLIISVGDFGVVKKSIDSGVTWQTVRGAYKLNNLNSIDAFNTSNIFAVGDNGELIRTVDNGNTWASLTIGSNNNLNDIAIYKAHAIIVGDSGTIINSTNNGVSWFVNTLYKEFNFKKVLFNDSTIFIMTNKNCILKSNNMGQNWEKIEFDPNFQFYDISLYLNEITIVGWQKEIIKSTDNFNTWKYINFTNSAEACFNFLQINDSLIFTSILTFGSVHAYSYDGGKTWVTGNNSFAPVNDFEISPNKMYTFICGSRGAIIRVDNKKDIQNPFYMFEPIVELGDKQLNFSLIDGFDPEALFAANQRYAFVSLDSGKNWDESLSLDKMDVVDIIQKDRNEYYLLADSSEFVQENGKSYNKHWLFLFYKFNNNNWINFLLDSGVILSKMQFNDNIGLISGFIYYYKTFDYGETWIKDSINDM